MNLPELNGEIQWFKDRLRPESDEYGNGIADWTITSEYVPDLTIEGRPCFGAMCSPGDHNSCLTPDDIAAKRAHVLVFVPRTVEDMKEFKLTLFHELRHVLYAMIAPYAEKDRAAEENATHSIDNFMKQLEPEELTLFRREMQTIPPMARSYRAKEGDMPDPIEEKKPDKPEENGEKKPTMQVRSVQEIEADLIKAVLAVQPTDELAKELVAAKALAQSASPAPETPEPQPEVTMGMKPEDAYARGKKEAEAAAEAKAVKAFAATVEGLSDDQRAMVREMPTVEKAQALVKTYPRLAGATMGMTAPLRATTASNAPTVRQRAMQADPDVLARVNRAASNEDTAGLHLDVPGHSLAWSPTGWLKEQYGAFKRPQKGAAE